MNEINNLKSARSKGLKMYFNGKPCKRGHLAMRVSANGGCVECEKHRKNAYNKSEKGKAASRRRPRRDLYGSALKSAIQAAPDGEYKKQLLRRKFWRRDGLPEPTRPMTDICEICGKTELLNGRALALDHCHETKTFRGWLCDHCNRGLGFLGDNLEGVRKALQYLQAWAASNNQGENT